MTDEKKLKRDIKKTWDALKQERQARSKLLRAAELTESAERIASHAADLKDLAKRMEGFERASPTLAPATKPKIKRKRKSGSKAPSA